MDDWEITGIVEDLESPDGERWLIVYRVSTDIAPNGVFSSSIPKSLLNTYAALYEYDIDDPEQVDDLFDHVMSLSMMKTVLHQEGRIAEQVNPMAVKPSEGRAKVKRLVGELKAGKAQLKAAPAVALKIQGMPAVADPSENPKYIVKRDMVARLNADAIAPLRQAYRTHRQAKLQEMS